jgi:hypothetical protein
MAISDIFSTSFLFSIAIIIILIGGIFAYVSYRMGEQDHKLNAMLGLVSTMAEESGFFRSKLNMLQQKIDFINLPDADKIQYASQMMGGSNQQEELINVSDDEDEDDEENEDEDEGEEESNDNDDYSEEEEENEVVDPLKLLDLTLANIDIDNLSIEDFNNNEEIKTVHLEEPIEFEDADIALSIDQNETKVSEEDINFLKTVSINDLGEVDDAHNSKNDYKKMSLNKLREIVVGKGLITDASKLKKNEVLKLLGDE